MIHGRGYKADPPGHRYNSFRAVHPAGRIGAAPVYDYSATGGPVQFIPPTYDQTQTSSCGGHAAGTALSILLPAQHIALPSRIKPLGCYDLARMVDRATYTEGDLPPLTDDGVMPNELARGLQVWGLPAEGDRLDDKTATDPDYTTWLMANVNRETTLGEFMAMDRRRILTDWTSIADGDPRKADLLVSALNAGFPAIGAIDANDPEFQNFDGGGVLEYSGQSPDHMQCWAQWRVGSNGEREFLEINSWGLAWGDGGRAWVTEKTINTATFAVLIPRLLT